MRPKINEEIIKKFLDGDNKYSGLKYVRFIDAPAWSNKANVIVRKSDTVEVKEIMYSPFIWSKPINFERFYCWEYLEAPLSEYNNEKNSFIHDGKVIVVDGTNVVNDGPCKDNEDVLVIRRFIPTIEGRKDYFKRKALEYNMQFKKLDTAYDKEEIARMKNGYRFLTKIDPHPADPQRPYDFVCSTNPVFKYRDGKKRKISGSFNDLQSFFKEGGIDIYEKHGTFFDVEKTKTFFEDKTNILRFFFDTVTPFKNKAGHVNIFKEIWGNSPYDKDSLFSYILSKKEWEHKLNSFYHPTKYDFTNIHFVERLDDNGYDLIDYEGDDNRILKDRAEIYITPKEMPCYLNCFEFMEGFIKLGNDYSKIEPHLKYDISQLAKKIKEYAPSNVVFDKDAYKKLWGEHFDRIRELVVFEISKITPKARTIKNLTKTNVFHYIDIIGQDEFIRTAMQDQVLDRIFELSPNLEFIESLDVKKDKDVFSFHTSKYGRKFMAIAAEKGYDILKTIEPTTQVIPPVSQFMYETGIRIFKGHEYKDLKRLVIDIETRALPEHEWDGRAALFPEKAMIFTIGIYGNYGFKKILVASTPEEEVEMITEAYRLIAQENPDVLIHYNGEEFDFPFMEKRLEILGCVAEDKWGNINSLQHIRNTIKSEFDVHYPDQYISNNSYYNKRANTVKAGGETKDTTQTSIFGINVMDGIHQTWKIMAINKEVEYAGLKWNIKHNKIGKANRVYIEGNDIGKTSRLKEVYFNDENGDWFENKKEYVFADEVYGRNGIKLDENNKRFFQDKRKLYIFTSDSEDRAINDCQNAFQINVGADDFEGHLVQCFNDIRGIIRNYDAIVIPKNRNGLSLKGTGKYGALITFLTKLVKSCDDLPTLYDHIDFEKYKLVEGSYIVERYLIDDLWETDVLFEKYAQSSFMLAKWGHNNLQRLALMGYASVWKIIISCWHYTHNIALPEYDEPREINGGLIGMIKAGFLQNIVKYDYSSLYPATKDAHIPPPDWDISEVSDWLLRFFLYTRLDYKGLAGKYKSEGNYALASMYDVLQLPLKIFINSYYGFLGANFVSTLADMITANFITANSRMLARHSIRYMMKEHDMVPIYCHTDGINFMFKGIDDFAYVGQGKNWLVEEGKQYTGLKAIVAKYNDTFFQKGKMGMGIDDVDKSCINIAKSNVVHYKTKYKDGKESYEMKITGGLVKKDTPEYIKVFVEENAEIILQNRPADFINNYYAYIDKIWNHKIKSKSIANKVRLKSTEEYLQNAKVKSAPYEIIIKNKLDVSPGSYFYWVNNGIKSGDSDYTVHKGKIGHFVFDMEHPDMEMTFAEWGTDEQVAEIKHQISSHHANGQFVFTKHRIVETYQDENGEECTRNTLAENASLIDGFSANNLLDLKYNYKIKKTKKETKILMEVHMHIEKFNSKWVSPEDYEATVEYNQRKYLDKFNSAISPLFIVFHPDVRKALIKNEPDNDGKFVVPELSEEQLQFVSGFPLEKKEHNQQNFEELMEVQPIERKFWVDVRKDPNWFLTEKELLADEYSIKDGNYTEGSEQSADFVVNLRGMVDYLSNNLKNEK